jgi:hypothetical protein
MRHVAVHTDDDSTARAQASAAAAKLVKEQTPEVDANGYPKGIFEHIAAHSHLFDDFPSLEEIRANMGTDLPRESM